MPRLSGCTCWCWNGWQRGYSGFNDTVKRLMPGGQLPGLPGGKRARAGKRRYTSARLPKELTHDHCTKKRQRAQVKDRAMVRAAIYVRVSDPKQEKGYSLQTQLAGCREYAAAHGYTVSEDSEFIESHTATLLQRPQMDKLLDLAES